MCRHRSVNRLLKLGRPCGMYHMTRSSLILQSTKYQDNDGLEGFNHYTGKSYNRRYWNPLLQQNVKSVADFLNMFAPLWRATLQSDLLVGEDVKDDCYVGVVLCEERNGEGDMRCRQISREIKNSYHGEYRTLRGSDWLCGTAANWLQCWYQKLNLNKTV